jgi:hypothetical protein
VPSADDQDALYESKKHFVSANSIYLESFDRVRNNHPFWAWHSGMILIYSLKANSTKATLSDALDQ